MPQRKSVVWNFYSKNKHDGNVTCKLCRVSYKHFGNTTNQLTHLKKQHPIQFLEFSDGSSPFTPMSSNSKNTVVSVPPPISQLNDDEEIESNSTYVPSLSQSSEEEETETDADYVPPRKKRQRSKCCSKTLSEAESKSINIFVCPREMYA